MSYFPASQEDSKVHVDASEQASHVLLATKMALHLQYSSKLQVPINMLEPGYAELPPALEIQVRSSFDLKLNAFAPENTARE